MQQNAFSLAGLTTFGEMTASTVTSRTVVGSVAIGALTGVLCLALTLPGQVRELVVSPTRELGTLVKLVVFFAGAGVVALLLLPLLLWLRRASRKNLRRWPWIPAFALLSSTFGDWYLPLDKWNPYESTPPGLLLGAVLGAIASAAVLCVVQWLGAKSGAHQAS